MERLVRHSPAETPAVRRRLHRHRSPAPSCRLMVQTHSVPGNGPDRRSTCRSIHHDLRRSRWSCPRQSRTGHSPRLATLQYSGIQPSPPHAQVASIERPAYSGRPVPPQVRHACAPGVRSGRRLRRLLVAPRTEHQRDIPAPRVLHRGDGAGVPFDGNHRAVRRRPTTPPISAKSGRRSCVSASSTSPSGLGQSSRSVARRLITAASAVSGIFTGGLLRPFGGSRMASASRGPCAGAPGCNPQTKLAAAPAMETCPYATSSSPSLVISLPDLGRTGIGLLSRWRPLAITDGALALRTSRCWSTQPKSLYS